MTRKQKSFFEAAEAVSRTSEFPRVHIGCVVTNGNHRIISSGVNSTKTHPIQKKYNAERFDVDICTQHSLHAELDALLPLLKEDIDFSKVELYTYRELADGTMAMSRPCPSCMKLIKDLGIRNIYYTTQDGYSHEEIDY